jgi:hypothetical protein
MTTITKLNLPLEKDNKISLTDNNYLYLDNNYDWSDHKYLTCDKDTLLNRFESFVGDSNIIKDILKHKDVIISGGLLSMMLRKNYNENDYKDSDIDIFIYNSDRKNIYKSIIITIINTFNNKDNIKDIQIEYKNKATILDPVIINITIIFNNTLYKEPLKFQIINFNEYNSILEIFNNFDLSCVQCCLTYNLDENVYEILCTEHYIKSLNNHIAEITNFYTSSIKRIFKYMYRGYKIFTHNYFTKENYDNILKLINLINKYIQSNPKIIPKYYQFISNYSNNDYDNNKYIGSKNRLIPYDIINTRYNKVLIKTYKYNEKYIEQNEKYKLMMKSVLKQLVYKSV